VAGRKQGWDGMTPCPRDADLKNGSRRKGERDTPAKQYQGKA
jgi:hypothetical protein